MPRRPHLTALVMLTAGAAGACGLGFGPVDVEPYEPTPGSEAACSDLVDALPEVVSDAVARDVTPESGLAAAWGRPPIVLRCGVELPPEYRPDARLAEIDGVAWLPVDGVGGTFFATVDRDPVVEIAVPDDYAPEADVLADLAGAVATHVPERTLP